MKFFSNQKVYLEDNISPERQTDEAIKWMEIQANGVAPHLIVSDEIIKEKALQLIDKYKYDDWTSEINLNYMENVISDLARMYGVTYPSLKRRLASMGFSDAHGALNYVDNSFAENYLVEEGTLDFNESYEISINTLICALACDERMKALFDERLITFVDNHLCINTHKYVKKWGKPKLTDYAKMHMHECCIKFTSLNGEKKMMLGSCLFRDISKTIYHSFSEGYMKILDVAKQIDENKKKIARINHVRKEILNLDFGDSLKFLMDYQNLTQKELARDSGVDQSTISKYLSKGMGCRNRKTLVALCCGLKAEPCISRMLFKKCGLALDDSNEDGVLTYIMTNMIDASPKDRNEFMKSYGFDSLTSEDYDKFDYDDLD